MGRGSFCFLQRSLIAPGSGWGFAWLSDFPAGLLQELEC